MNPQIPRTEVGREFLTDSDHALVARRNGDWVLVYRIVLRIVGYKMTSVYACCL